MNPGRDLYSTNRNKALCRQPVWRWLFHDQYGIVNWSLTGLGLSGFEGYAWFNQRLSAFIAIGLMSLPIHRARPPARRPLRPPRSRSF